MLVLQSGFEIVFRFCQPQAISGTASVKDLSSDVPLKVKSKPRFVLLPLLVSTVDFFQKCKGAFLLFISKNLQNQVENYLYSFCYQLVVGLFPHLE